MWDAQAQLHSAALHPGVNGLAAAEQRVCFLCNRKPSVVEVAPATVLSPLQIYMHLNLAVPYEATLPILQRENPRHSNLRRL